MTPDEIRGADDGQAPIAKMVLPERDSARVRGLHLVAATVVLVTVALGSASARTSTGGFGNGNGNGNGKEYAVKAAFLYSFGNFVAWPADERGQDKQFVIGILGKDPFGKIIDQALLGKEVQGRPVRIRRVSGPDGLDGCRVLFIAGLSYSEGKELLDKLSNRPVLTVGETEGFAQGGGMIGFYIKGGKIRLQINRAVAERSGLQISSRLLGVSQLVEETK